MCYLPKTKERLQVNATRSGSTERKKRARSKLLDLCQYDAGDAIVETQPAEGQQQERKLSELAVTPDISEVGRNFSMEPSRACLMS
jgi:ATP-dependent DNA ligase